MKPWIVFSGLKIMAGLLVALMALGTQARGDVVYTTNTTAGQASNGGTLTQDANNNLKIGTWTTAGTNTFSFNPSQSVIRFTTNGSLGTNGTWSLSSLNSNIYFDPGTGSQKGSTVSGSLNWTLYSGTSTSQVATYTQTLTNISVAAGSTASSNVYQNNLFSLASGTNVLNANTQYTLVLTGGTISASATIEQNSDLHWAYYSGTPATTGQLWAINAAGSTAATAYTGGAQAITGANFAFDINAAAIPEPGTLALGSIAAVACACLWWYRRKTGPQAAAQGT